MLSVFYGHDFNYFLFKCLRRLADNKERKDGIMRLLKIILRTLTTSMVVYFVLRAFISAHAIGDGLKALLP